MRYNTDMVFSMLRWWYGQGWMLALERTPARMRNVLRQLSAGLLLRTLFEPWRRTVTAGAKGLSVKLQEMVGNGVSRLVGFVVRLFVLFAALLMVAALGLFGVIEMIGWPLVPLAVVYFAIRGITG